MKKILSFLKKCRKSQTNVFVLTLRFLYYKLFYNKTLLVHQNTIIKGLKNLYLKAKIEIGIGQVGFIFRKDKTLLNIKGTFKINGRYKIGRGCRFNIGEKALVTFGEKGRINCNSLFIIMHRLSIGNRTNISWGCQFLDEDFHELSFAGKKKSKNQIIIGNDVWIGCCSYIYKGTVIPDGCVIAANSVVRDVFKEKNCLIGGHPAKILKRNVSKKDKIEL